MPLKVFSISSLMPLKEVPFREPGKGVEIHFVILSCEKQGQISPQPRGFDLTDMVLWVRTSPLVILRSGDQLKSWESLQLSCL